MKRSSETGTPAVSGYTTAPRVTIAAPPPDLLVTYDYYPDRSLAKITDWTGRVTTFRYYQDGRLHSIERPNHTTRTFAYTVSVTPSALCGCLTACGAVLVR